jgi:hypothetical protein
MSMDLYFDLSHESNQATKVHSSNSGQFFEISLIRLIPAAMQNATTLVGLLLWHKAAIAQVMDALRSGCFESCCNCNRMQDRDLESKRAHHDVSTANPVRECEYEESVMQLILAIWLYLVLVFASYLIHAMTKPFSLGGSVHNRERL